jgi:hypothetical protein
MGVHKILKTVCVGVATCAAIFTAGGLLAYESSRGPTELIYWDAEKAFSGYSIIRPRRRGDGSVYLIDMAGQVVHEWSGFNNGQLLEDGTLFGGTKNGIAVADWDGRILWEYRETRENYRPHHEYLRVYNAELEDFTVLYIASVALSHEEVIALGADPDAVDRYEDVEMDAIVEVDRNGDVIWEFHFKDHVVQDVSAGASNHVGRGRSIGDYPGRLDINFGVVKEDYLHLNGIDYNPANGHLAISSNNTHEIYIVDHDGTFVAGDVKESMRLAASDAGDFLYRFGSPANYGQGKYPYYSKNKTPMLEHAGHKQIGGNHDIQWIKDGLPGAGNLLLFNNGLSVPRAVLDPDPQSEVMEINPNLDASGTDTGRYVNPPEAGYTIAMPGDESPREEQAVTRMFSKQIVSMYHTLDTFKSYRGSAVQRLPNGNNLVQLSKVGRLVEVTPDGEVVYDYINPMTPDGPQTILITSQHTNNLVGWSPMRYPVDYPGLSGKDLTPKGPITEYAKD